MFTVKCRYRAHIKEQEFCSEAQAVSVAYKQYESGCWQYVQVFVNETDESIVELGSERPNAPRSNFYAEAI